MIKSKHCNIAVGVSKIFNILFRILVPECATSNSKSFLRSHKLLI